MNHTITGLGIPLSDSAQREGALSPAGIVRLTLAGYADPLP
jgi:hypothetical protein